MKRRVVYFMNPKREPLFTLLIKVSVKSFPLFYGAAPEPEASLSGW